MSDLVAVALIAGVFTVITALVQAIGVRVNTRQHGASMERLKRIEDTQMKVAEDLIAHREKSQEYRDLQSRRHEQNVGRLKDIDTHIDEVDAHVKAVDERVKHLEGDIL